MQNMNSNSSFLEKNVPKNGVYYLTSAVTESFENAYISVRKREKRIYDDGLVKLLPNIHSDHFHHSEWNLRRSHFFRLKRYFGQYKIQNGALDLGCGNGWFTHHLHQWIKAPVYGIDVNRLELEQAARLFNQPTCTFIYADIFTAVLPPHHFDLICLNSVIQYFPSLEQLLNHLFSLLRDKGEIHIIDSPLYQEKELADAKARTRSYYDTMGLPEMAEHYFHHSWDALGGFNYDKLYSNTMLINKLKSKFIKRQNPFPWLRLKK